MPTCLYPHATLCLCAHTISPFSNFLTPSSPGVATPPRCDHHEERIDRIHQLYLDFFPCYSLPPTHSDPSLPRTAPPTHTPQVYRGATIRTQLPPLTALNCALLPPLTAPYLQPTPPGVQGGLPRGPHQPQHRGRADTEGRHRPHHDTQGAVQGTLLLVSDSVIQ